MRIAMLAPISWRVPPRHYGPWEQVVGTLTEGLVRKGIDVTLFATADSQTSAKLEAVCPRPYSEDPTLDAKVWECLHIAHCFGEAHRFDVIHNHFDFLPLSFSGLVNTPVVTTIHGFSSPRILPVFERHNSNTHYVAISDADRAPTLDYLATIYHGIPIEQFALKDRSEGYLLFFGRIHPDKGCAEAIALAKKLRTRLVIAGSIQDQRYFEEQVAPQLQNFIEYIGPVGPERRSEVLGGALALIHLINFPEPFGLSVVEAMACGTPVIAKPLGSMPEIIRHGENGFLVETIDEAAEAVPRCARLSPSKIRAGAVERFSVERMVDEYVRAYEQIASMGKTGAGGNGKRLPSSNPAGTLEEVFRG
jgi:glycosyltransferase involved in cell wall biosynthesis